MMPNFPKKLPELFFFLALALAAFFLFASFSYLFPSKQEIPQVQALEKQESKEIEPPPFELSAKGIFVLETTGGEVLFAKNEDTPYLPASTTKMATAIVALIAYGLEDVLIIPRVSAGTHTMGLIPGEKITVRSLLYGVLVYSANDAAEVLAYHYPGGRENFILAMNKLAPSVGLENTNFVNPTGFDDYLHFSTAEDLVLLAAHGLSNPIFSEMVRTEAIDVKSVDGRIIHKLVSTNQLLGKVPGVIGVKTGWTQNSGESLVTLVERDGRRVIIGLVGSSDRFGETKTLIDWIFQK